MIWKLLLIFAFVALAVTVLFGLLYGLNPWVVTAFGWAGGLATAGVLYLGARRAGLRLEDL